jgi:hypothetical protein
MPNVPSPGQQAASRANGARSQGPTPDAGKARAARNGTRHGPRGDDFCLLPGEDAQKLDLLRQAVAADWRPRDAYERHWAGELVAAMWRQQRLRGLELAALAAVEEEHPPSEASLMRLLTFARYGARLDKELAQALRALRVLKGRPTASLAEHPGGPAEAATHTPKPAIPEPPRSTARPARAPEPEPSAGGPSPDRPLPQRAPNRHERRRLAALERLAARWAA